MHAEIVAIGDELVSGARLDTNSQWLAEQLELLGLPVQRHHNVGDQMPLLVETLRQAAQAGEVVLCTGGLGPTADDLTREALAELADVELELHEPTLAHLDQLFAHRRGRPMPERNRVQAYIPQGAEIIPNPHGTAPGVDLRVPIDGGARFFALPGVPAEMRQMYQETVRPRLESLLGASRQVIRQRLIKCFGVGESDLEAMLPDMIRRGHEPAVGITVSRATISLRIVARGPDEPACQRQIAGAAGTIYDCLGSLVFGEGDVELQHVVLERLAQRGETLATAEWLSDGLLAGWLAAASETLPNETGPNAARRETVRGSSVYASAETGLLALEAAEVEHDALVKAGQTLRERTRSDYALLVAGNRGSQGEVALIGPDVAEVKPVSLALHPDIVRPRLCKAGLNLLRLHLAQRDGSAPLRS